MFTMKSSVLIPAMKPLAKVNRLKLLKPEAVMFNDTPLSSTFVRLSSKAHFPLRLALPAL